ncbi:MAG: hypothetical protein HRU00_17975 [Myxococcales bacterium]|nr:hypothetical protein [Myxococcales bacterium]
MEFPTDKTTIGSTLSPETPRNLRAAWDSLISDLERARDAIDDPKLYPPPASDRSLSEGYRYVLGFLYGAIDRAFADPDYPQFRRAIQPLDRATIDNADASYLCAEIDGSQSYCVRGRARAHEHWRGKPRTGPGPWAPQYMILEATSAYAGDSGELAELSTRVRANTGSLDSSSLELEDDGSFEVLLAPERPDGHRGNFVATRALRSWQDPDGRSEQVEHTARFLVLRELFYDWEREEALELEIFQLGREGTHPAPLSPERAALQVRRIGEIVRAQTHFWNEFYAVVLETYEDMNGDGKRFMPRNDLNPPNRAAIATGGGQSTNIYSGGVFDLDPDEALVIEVRMAVEPQYLGFHLSNLWGESLDYANHVTSLNGFQTRRDADGAVRYVVAHRDPGLANWVDTTGLPEGYLTVRWSYSQKQQELPEVAVRKLRFGDLEKALPAPLLKLSKEERIEQVRIRQQHVQRRYRQY